MKNLETVKYLRGKKTYIIGIITIVVGIFIADTPLILQGLAVITLRAGIGTPKQVK